MRPLSVERAAKMIEKAQLDREGATSISGEELREILNAVHVAMKDDEIDKFRASERGRMQPMREAARKEAFVQGYIAGRFPRENERTDEELLSELPAADAAYAKVILKHRGPA